MGVTLQKSRFLNNFLEKYIFLALSTGAVTTFTYISSNLEIQWTYVAFVITSTFLLYNYHFLFSVNRNMFFDKQNRNHLIHVVLLGMASGALFLPLLSVTNVILLLLAVLLVLGYYGKLGRKLMLRNWWLKPFTIGLVFAITTMTIPLMDTGNNGYKILSTTLERTLFIAALALAFDIGDVMEDLRGYCKTIPVKIGIQHSVLIAWSWLFLAFLLDIMAMYAGWKTSLSIYSLIITYVMSAVLIWHAAPTKHDYYYLFQIDGMIGFPMLMWFVLNFAGL
ncbi:MAG: hypothetical protein J5I52_05920 [Saprospiraceae bacterium]|nr:MAG: 4-hydroxybenzoate polyprenyltransferase [Bacteroidetes bacterium OLB9]MCO6463669.1 hypothetical protein [Saprospiraceae bacterium]MCZ2336768.1 hypothetical protein [Chitinophagales bacterium]